MRDEPSRTARGTAAFRAAHQILHNGSVFRDTYALAITGMTRDEVLQIAVPRLGLVSDVVVRSRFTEDRIANAAKSGLKQVAIMGAGLDTFGLRNPYAAGGLRVFEVDHPQTQNFKRQRISSEGWTIDDEHHIFVPVNFETESWVNRLQESGCDFSQPIFFTWLGVVTYLKKETTYACIKEMSQVPLGETIIEYGYAPEYYAESKRTGLLNEMARCKELGEPWIGLFGAGELQSALQQNNFTILQDCGPYEAMRSYNVNFFTPPQLGSPGACLIHARRN